MAILQLADDLKKGVAPRDLRPNMVALAIAVRDDSPQTALAHLFAYWHAYYAGSEAEAASLLETSLQYSSSLPPVLHESLLCEAGIFQASKRKRTDLARAWLADLPKKSKHLVRLEGAILETEEDFPGALGKIDEVVAETLNRPDRPSRATSLRLLREWRSEVLEKANAQLVSPAQ